MLDVRRLLVLREVASRGSFSAAAEALSFTQSSVSQQISALERETATKLVERERGGRTIRLTAAGAALVNHAEAIRARLKDAEQELEAIAGLDAGQLRLACFQSAGATLVPGALAAFHDQHPSVELGVLQAEPPEARQAMAAGEADIAIVYDFEGQIATLPADLELTHLLHDPYDLILPRGHPLAKKQAVSLSDLANDSWVLASQTTGCHQLVRQACRQAGIEPLGVIETDENDAVQAFVAGGLGVSLQPRLALATLHPGVVVKRLGPHAPTRRVWTAHIHGTYHSPASQALQNLLLDAAAKHNTRVPQTTAP